MSEERREREQGQCDRGPRDGGDRPGPRDEGGRRGPPGTEFLDLEVSRVMFAEADGLVRDAARELMREAIRARLKERIGEQLEAIGRLAADSFLDDLAANIEIERLISERRQSNHSNEERLREIAARLRRP